jgi:hypothetical protein
MTVPIVFNSGAYGTYLEWCLTSLCSSNDLISPFKSHGNSHNYHGVHLLNMQGWRQYLEKTDSSDFVRFHPKSDPMHSLEKNLEEILQSVDKVIFLYPDNNSVLLNINNWIDKVYDDWWIHMWTNHTEFCLDPNLLYNKWPVDSGTPIQDIARWIRREFLSMYLVPAWQSQVEWFFPDRWQSPKCKYVFTKNLLYDFENTITDLVFFLQLNIKKSVSELLPYHEENMKLQKHTNQDRICNQIIESILNDNVITWDTLPLASEAWMQWKLRELGYEIQCHGLDMFPTNSVQLKELLYTP